MDMEDAVMYFDRDGEPLADVLDWARRFEDADYKRVAADLVGDVDVSTVWLGLDHSFGGPVPLIFETMIFGGDHDGEQWRYPTEDAARAGHAAVVALVRAAAGNAA